jgi:hypothetical protein
MKDEILGQSDAKLSPRKVSVSYWETSESSQIRAFVRSTGIKNYG